MCVSVRLITCMLYLDVVSADWYLLAIVRPQALCTESGDIKSFWWHLTQLLSFPWSYFCWRCNSSKVERRHSKLNLRKAGAQSMWEHGVLLTHIFPFKDRIGLSDSILILENTGLLKPSFSHIFTMYSSVRDHLLLFKFPILWWFQFSDP